MNEPKEESKAWICKYLLKPVSSFFNQQGAMTVVFVVFVLVVACIYYTSASKEPEFFLVTILFFAPVALQWGIFTVLPQGNLRGCYTFFLSGSIAWYLLSWAGYTVLSSTGGVTNDRQASPAAIPWDQWLAGAFLSWGAEGCLALAFAFVFVAVVVTWLILDDEPQEPVEESSSQKNGLLRRVMQMIRLARSVPATTRAAGERWLVRLRADPFVRVLIRESGVHRFSSVVFFFAIFLSVTYLISFSFAFHDKYQRTVYACAQEKARRKSNQHDTKELNTSSAFSGQQSSIEKIDGNCPNDPHEVSPVGLFYKNPVNGKNPAQANAQKKGNGQVPSPAGSGGPSSSVVSADTSPAPNLEPPNSSNPACPGVGGKAEKIWTVMFQESSARIETERKENLDPLEKIEKCLCEYDHFRVVLVGYTNNKRVRPASGYGSNYELAEARALNVKREILSRIQKCSPSTDGKGRIEWHWAASPSEDEGRTAAAGKTVVDISILPLPDASSSFDKLKGLIEKQSTDARDSEAVSSELQLLDYIYFTVYTITTTGYGDIIPVTGFAKFVTSVANIFEVFFLVIFFNALVSRRR